MCHLFASQPPDRYTFETRSIRLNGQSTSIRLERVFWDILEDIAEAERISVPRFILGAASGNPTPARGSSQFHLPLALHLRHRLEPRLTRAEDARAKAA